MFKGFLEGQQASSFKSDAKIIGFAVRCKYFLTKYINFEICSTQTKSDFLEF